MVPGQYLLSALSAPCSNSSFRVIHEIERILTRGAHSPRREYDKSKIEQYKLGIQQILENLTTQSPSLNADNDTDGDTPRSLSVRVGSRDAATTSASESGRRCSHFHLFCCDGTLTTVRFCFNFGTQPLDA